MPARNSLTDAAIMRITVIGAGAIGAAVGKNLVEREAVTQVQMCDHHARSLRSLHNRIDNPKLRSFQVDARDHSVLRSIIQGSSCVISCMPAMLHPSLAKLCLEMGIAYCDLGGNDEAVRQILKLDKNARERSVWLVPNCGLAPGLVNVLCLRGIEQFDEVEAARLRVGDIPLNPNPPFNFRVSWSAEKVVDDYMNPVQLITDGQVREYEPLSRQEHIHFPPPFEEMEAFCTAGGLTTLTEDLAGKVNTLDHKSIRWPGHADQMRFLIGLGFGERRTIDVRTHLTYRDILVRRLRSRLGGKFKDAVLLRVLIQGTQQGQKRTLVYEMVDRYDEERDLTAMERCTSIPTATAAVLISSPEMTGGGAAPPEHVVDHDRYCTLLSKQGLDITTRWHDGYVEVTQLADETPTA